MTFWPGVFFPNCACAGWTRPKSEDLESFQKMCGHLHSRQELSTRWPRRARLHAISRKNNTTAARHSNKLHLEKHVALVQPMAECFWTRYPSEGSHPGCRHDEQSSSTPSDVAVVVSVWGMRFIDQCICTARRIIMFHACWHMPQAMLDALMGPGRDQIEKDWWVATRNSQFEL